MFRELQHDNLCKFLGAIILKDRRWPEDRIALVMEMYPENLRSVIFNDDYVPPASAVDASSPSVVRFLQWASQLANALAHIHRLKLIHKHLKLENIMVSILFIFDDRFKAAWSITVRCVCFRCQSVVAIFLASKIAVATEKGTAKYVNKCRYCSWPCLLKCSFRPRLH